MDWDGIEGRDLRLIAISGQSEWFLLGSGYLLKKITNLVCNCWKERSWQIEVYILRD